MSILNNLINGISLGSVYAIIALGYTMVYGIAKMLNFAHGDVIMVGAYICFFTMSGLSGSFEEGSLAGAVVPALAGVLLAMVVCTILGMVIERLAYKPLRQAPSLAVRWLPASSLCWGSPGSPDIPAWARPCGPVRKTRRLPSSWVST